MCSEEEPITMPMSTNPHLGVRSDRLLEQQDLPEGHAGPLARAEVTSGRQRVSEDTTDEKVIPHKSSFFAPFYLTAAEGQPVFHFLVPFSFIHLFIHLIQ